MMTCFAILLKRTQQLDGRVNVLRQIGKSCAKEVMETYMSLFTGAKKVSSPSSVVEYARLPTKTWMMVRRSDLGKKR